MYTKTVSVVNHVGLHAHPATFLIQKANSFPCGIWIEKEDRRVNAKSLLGVLSLGVGQGDTVKIIADGESENEAVDTLCDLIVSGFEE